MRKCRETTANVVCQRASPNLSRFSIVLTFPAVLIEVSNHSVYPPCTSLRRFCGFSPFCPFVESVSYAVSIPPRGSNPTRASKLSRFVLNQLTRTCSPRTRPVLFASTCTQGSTLQALSGRLLASLCHLRRFDDYVRNVPLAQHSIESRHVRRH
jgi:hypothetical protein